MRIFTKIGVTVAAGAFPVMLWAGAASAQQSQSQQNPQQSQQSQQSQSQSQSSVSTVSTTPSNLGGGGGTGGTGGTLARTGAEDLLPLALGGAAVAGAVAVRGVRRRSVI